MRVVVTALNFAERPAQLPQRVRDGHRDQDGARQPDRQRGDRQQQDRRDQPFRGRGEDLELAGDQREHDGENWHAGGQHPRQDLAQDDARGAEVLGYTAAQRGHRDRTQHALRLQIPDDRRGGGAESGGNRDDRRRLAGHRPAGDDEHHRAQEPVGHVDDRAVKGHLQRTRAGHFGGGRVAVAQQRLAALPAHYRDQQPQAQIGRDGERDEQVGQEDREVERGQVLQLDAVLGRQPEAQKAQYEQRADDVGLQHAE